MRALKWAPVFALLLATPAHAFTVEQVHRWIDGGHCYLYPRHARCQPPAPPPAPPQEPAPVAAPAPPPAPVVTPQPESKPAPVPKPKPKPTKRRKRK